MKLDVSHNKKFVASFCSAFLVLLAVSAVLSSAADATHQPADKMAVSGSALEILSVEITEGSHSETHTLLAGTLRTSAPTDLVLRATAECALWTNIGTVGNAFSESVASVKVWAEIDGTPVPVSADDTTETGKVVFCNRAWRQEVTASDDEDLAIRQFMRTRAANAFNWITFNAGSGIHTIELKAQIDLNVATGGLGDDPGAGVGMAKAGVGKRTLIVEPVKLANDASV